MRTGRRAALLVALASFCVALAPAARAETITVDGGAAQVVKIELKQAALTVRTWDRSTVEVDAEPGAVAVSHSIRQGGPAPVSMLVPAAQLRRPTGPVGLPSETFVISTLPGGKHDFVQVQATNSGRAGPVTVTVPSDTAVLLINVERGSVGLHDYKGGTFVVYVRNGQTVLQNVGGDGFVQVLQGNVQAFDSNFNRLRVRTAVGTQVYQRCHAKQIEALSVESAVVYEGTFEPGLARFESTDGNVAVGVSGATHLVGLAGAGRVYTAFDQKTPIQGRGAEASATYSGGGPLVNASSATGSVYFYDGILSPQRKLPPEWRPVIMSMRPEWYLPALPRREFPPNAPPRVQGAKQRPLPPPRPFFHPRPAQPHPRPR